MPSFAYRAKTLDNIIVKGTASARDRDELYRTLHAKGQILLSAKETGGSLREYKMKPLELSEFSRQLGDMLDSGITVSRALSIMKEREPKAELRTVYGRLSDDILKGMTLSEAMRAQPRTFPELLINMFIAGEESGRLEHTARKMAVHYDKEFRLNGKVRGAMMYPAILLSLTAAVVLLIFAVVLPGFFEFIESIDAGIPPVTKVVIAISRFVVGQWYILLIAGLFLFISLKLILSTRRVRLWFDRVKLRMLRVGRLLRIIYTARFARTLSSLYTSGLPMLEALTIAASTVGNKYIEAQFARLITDVRNGRMLSDALLEVDGFDPKLGSVVYVGEESGKLNDMLENVAESFDYEAEVATSRLVTLLGPVCLVVMAVVIGTIMISVMLPIFNIYEFAGSGGLS